MGRLSSMNYEDQAFKSWQSAFRNIYSEMVPQLLAHILASLILAQRSATALAPALSGFASCRHCVVIGHTRMCVVLVYAN